MTQVAQTFDMVLQDGETITVKYIETDDESPDEMVHYFIGRVVGMPGAIGSGRTMEQLKEVITDAYYGMKKFNEMYPKL